MKLTTIAQFLLTGIIFSTAGLSSESVLAQQLPPIVDSNVRTGSTGQGSNNNIPEVIVAAASSLKVSCQDFKTVVQKGDRQAVMVTWNYNGFGREFTPEKRCQMVSERLQQAANLNGGTFKELQLASGTVNSQVVICAVQSNGQRCDRQNMLFTLNPENARNPEATMQKIFTFAQNGRSSVQESTRSQPRSADLNLGNWENRAFPQANSSLKNERNNPDT
ncbi:COP23 domain-containing protein, partial [Chamaesiphon polymorphus]